MIDFVVLTTTCKSCGGVQLVRIKQTQTDNVVCPECWAAGEYVSVAEESAGLRDGWDIADDVKDHVRIARALSIARVVVGARTA